MPDMRPLAAEAIDGDGEAGLCPVRAGSGVEVPQPDGCVPEVRESSECGGAGEVGEAIHCKRCGGRMRIGIALGQTAVARRRPNGPNDCRTFYAGGTGRIVTCFKCEACGASVTKGASE